MKVTTHNDMITMSSHFAHLVRDFPTSRELTRRIEAVIKEHTYTTSSDECHYRGADQVKMRGALKGLKASFARDNTEFGYWFEEEFYSTKKTTTHKSVDILLAKQWPQSQWDSLKRELVYSVNLKTWS